MTLEQTPGKGDVAGGGGAGGGAFVCVFGLVFCRILDVPVPFIFLNGFVEA